MFYPVKVYKPDGTLKEEISVQALRVKHWKEIDINIAAIEQLKKPSSMADPTPKRPRAKPIQKVVSIWPRECKYELCSKYFISRSYSGRYCSPECRKNEANKTRRDNRRK